MVARLASLNVELSSHLPDIIVIASNDEWSEETAVELELFAGYLAQALLLNHVSEDALEEDAIVESHEVVAKASLGQSAQEGGHFELDL